jgi:hypothetical protein
VFLTHPFSINNVTELKIEMRAKSGPQWPNLSRVYLVDGSDYYAVQDYGESNRKADWIGWLNGHELVYRYDIGDRAYEWHDFAWTREADGWWSLSIDGNIEWANFYQETNPLTSFDKIAVQILRNQSEIEWVRISVPEPATLSLLGLGGLALLRRRRAI